MEYTECILPVGFKDEMRVVHLLSNKAAVLTLDQFIQSNTKPLSEFINESEQQVMSDGTVTVKLLSWVDLEASFENPLHPFMKINYGKHSKACLLGTSMGERVLRFFEDKNDHISFNGKAYNVPAQMSHPWSIMMSPVSLDSERTVLSLKIRKQGVYIRFTDLDWLPDAIRPCMIVLVPSSNPSFNGVSASQRSQEDPCELRNMIFENTMTYFAESVRDLEEHGGQTDLHNKRLSDCRAKWNALTQQ